MRQSEPKQRPRLPEVSEEMKVWSAALTEELMTFPGVTRRPMFGFTGLYRSGKIFAALPASRGMESPNGLAFKLVPARPALLNRLRQDPRVSYTQMQKARWFTFELGSDSDLRDALTWLARAYEAAGRKK